jgi:hypothetical protein
MTRYVRRLRCCIAPLAGSLALPVIAAAEPNDTPPPFRVLLLSGANNHDWRSTTPALQRVLEGSDRDAVHVVDERDLPTDIDPMRWQREDGSVALLDDDEIIWRFSHDPNAGKPFFHPLAPRDGPALTGLRPLDHPWHYGLWFSWKYINGVNYWEEDRTTGLAEGRTTWTVRRLITEESHTAHIELDVAYHEADTEPVLTERRVIKVGPPDADGAYAIDWAMTFTAHTDVVLDRTPLPDEPGGKVYGGYAGLSLRLAVGMTERQVTSSEGPVDFADNRHRSRAAAMEYSGLVGDERAGIAIIAHPSNLNAPSPWYVIKGPVMSFFSPAVICYGPHEVPEGESFTLRYRVLVHNGAWDNDRLGAEVERYETEAGVEERSASR